MVVPGTVSVQFISIHKVIYLQGENALSSCLLSHSDDMMPIGQKPSEPPWMSATILTSVAKTASMTLTTGTGAATPTTQ